MKMAPKMLMPAQKLHPATRERESVRSDATRTRASADSTCWAAHSPSHCNQIELWIQGPGPDLLGSMRLPSASPHLHLLHYLIAIMDNQLPLIDADLLGIGEHCSLSTCHALDFLPFKCLGCGGTFCLEHRANHNCPSSSGAAGSQVIVCPICAKGVRLAPGQDANEAFDQHHRSSGCDPSNYKKVNQKQRCPVGRCQEKLTLTNTYRCKKCNLRVCLKHRDPADHNCTSTTSAAASSRPPATSSTAAASQPRPILPIQQTVLATSMPRSQQKSSAPDPLNTVKGTAERRRDMVNSINPLHLSQTQQPALNEACPMCSVRFASVERLIQHVEEFHPQETTQPSSVAAGSHRDSSAYQYRCEFCQRGFHNAVDVLHHSERCPMRGSTRNQGASSSSCEIS